MQGMTGVVALSLAIVIAISGLCEAQQCSRYKIPPNDIIKVGCKALNTAKSYFTNYQGLCTKEGSGSCEWCRQRGNERVCRGIVDNSINIVSFTPKGCSILSLDATTGRFEGKFSGADLVLTGMDRDYNTEFGVNLTLNMAMKFSMKTNEIDNECFTNFTLNKIRRNPSAKILGMNSVTKDEPLNMSRLGKYLLQRRLPNAMGAIINDMFQRLSMKASTLKLSLALLQ